MVTQDRQNEIGEVETYACSMCGAIQYSTDFILVRRDEFERAVNAHQKPKIKKRRSRSPIDRDQKVREFLFAKQGVSTIKELRLLAIKKFGIARTPSHSAIHRFLQRQNLN